MKKIIISILVLMMFSCEQEITEVLGIPTLDPEVTYEMIANKNDYVTYIINVEPNLKMNYPNLNGNYNYKLSQNQTEYVTIQLKGYWIANDGTVGYKGFHLSTLMYDDHTYESSNTFNYLDSADYHYTSGSFGWENEVEATELKGQTATFLLNFENVTNLVDVTPPSYIVSGENVKLFFQYQIYGRDIPTVYEGSFSFDYTWP